MRAGRGRRGAAPRLVTGPRAATAAMLATVLRARTGLSMLQIEPAGRIEYAFTHRRVHMRLFRCEAASGRVRLDGWDTHRWVSTSGLAALPLGTVTKRALAAVGVS
jgi:adenine-specific DNA glycosylase